MKTAQELRTGNVFMVGSQPMVVQMAEFSKAGGAATVKVKMKDLLTGEALEAVYRADDKFDVIALDRKDCTYVRFADPVYIFMDEASNQHEVGADALGDAIHYIGDGIEDVCEVTFYEDNAISVVLPTTVIREVEYTTPAAGGDTSSTVLKPARLRGATFEVSVPDFIAIGDKIEIDTRTNKFLRRDG